MNRVSIMSIAILLPIALAGCGGNSSKGDVDDTDTDTQSSEDSGSSSDTGSDTNPDTGAAETGSEFCEEEMPAATNNECWTEKIGCGDTVEMSLLGGFSYFDDEIYAYREWTCWPLIDPGTYTGPERAFIFEHPGENKYATIKLEGNCDDLTLVGIKVDAQYDGCPTGEPVPNECEWSNNNGAQDESIVIFENIYSPWLIVVDAEEASEANFRLTVECN